MSKTMSNCYSNILLVAVSLLISATVGHVVNYETVGAVPDDDSLDTCNKNGALMNKTLAGLQPYDVLLIPNKTYHLMGGIYAVNLSSIVIQVEGTLYYSNDIKHWPLAAGQSGRVMECMYFETSKNITFTSSGKGTLNGNGDKWWGVPGIGYLERGENRPRLLRMEHCSNVLVENLLFLNSPYWTTLFGQVDGLVIRYSDIDARREKDDGHNIIDLTAFNTDGFDVTGQNVHIHDCNIWNQDDCIAVKDGSQNMLFERINASGLGLTIGSISGSIVKNITFRDSYMHKTVKGIYLKFRGGTTPGLIADVLYENIVMDAPSQWPIWIGPAQQADNPDPCHPGPCSLCWPEDPAAKCDAPAAGSFRNITLRNITVNNPEKSPGVLFGNSTNPMQGLVFDNVVVKNPGKEPWGKDFYKCEGIANGVATGNTYPVPPCFKDMTDRAIAQLE